MPMPIHVGDAESEFHFALSFGLGVFLCWTIADNKDEIPFFAIKQEKTQCNLLYVE